VNTAVQTLRQPQAVTLFFLSSSSFSAASLSMFWTTALSQDMA
jgi:hypothetical protein